MPRKTKLLNIECPKSPIKISTITKRKRRYSDVISEESPTISNQGSQCSPEKSPILDRTTLNSTTPRPPCYRRASNVQETSSDDVYQFPLTPPRNPDQNKYSVLLKPESYKVPVRQSNLFTQTEVEMLKNAEDPEVVFFQEREKFKRFRTLNQVKEKWKRLCKKESNNSILKLQKRIPHLI